MAKGKRGPYPQMKVTEETGVTVIEESFLPEDPPIEEIVGQDNIVDVDQADDAIHSSAGYQCSNCTFKTHLLAELEEHVSGTGHGGGPVPQIPIPPTTLQPELFSTPGIVHKMIEVPLDGDFLNKKRASLAELYQSALDVKAKKKSADSVFNAQLAEIDEQMQEIARVLQKPYTYDTIDCEWKILDEENARGLYRIDTGELVEEQPLTAEDMAKSEDQAAAENAEPEAPAEVELEIPF